MNFLFGFAQGIVSALLFLAAYFFVSRKLKWEIISKKYRKYEQPVIISTAALVFLIVLGNNLGTYGPRIQLDQTRLPAPPEVTQVEGGAEMTTRKKDERVGQFDERIKDEP